MSLLKWWRTLFWESKLGASVSSSLGLVIPIHGAPKMAHVFFLYINQCFLREKIKTWPDVSLSKIFISI